LPPRTRARQSETLRLLSGGKAGRFAYPREAKRDASLTLGRQSETLRLLSGGKAGRFAYSREAKRDASLTWGGKAGRFAYSREAKRGRFAYCEVERLDNS
jgi:hypothetical protein